MPNQEMSESEQQQSLDAVKEAISALIEDCYDQYAGNTVVITALGSSLEELKTLAHLVPALKTTEPAVRRLAMEAFETRLHAAMNAMKKVKAIHNLGGAGSLL